MREHSIKTMKKLKIAICLCWVVLFAVFGLVHNTSDTSGQTRSAAAKDPRIDDSAPDAETIERFDRAVQNRFLTQPDFGIRRMVPTTPEPLTSVHVGSFSPVNDEERQLIKSFTDAGWKVGLYLFGRRATPNGDDKNPLEKFKIQYRINQPVAVTPGLPEKDLPGAKRLIKEVKNAFLTFQADQEAGRATTQFAKDEWTFVARPVRAVNASCIQCHTDYVVTSKLDDGRFRFRKRAVGDVNGIIVYGFSREKQSR